MAAALGCSGIHDCGIGLLNWLGLQVAFGDLVEAALVVECVILDPEPLDQAEPFLGAGVPLGVSEHCAAEHVYFRLVPPGHDVERVAATGDVVDHRGLLGGKDRMIERDMRSSENAGRGCGGGNAGGPGVGFEARSLRIGGAAEAMPAGDRHQRFEFHLLGEPGERDRIAPGDVEAAVEIRHHAAAVEVGLEGPELQPAAAQRRIGLVPVPLSIGKRGHRRN